MNLSDTLTANEHETILSMVLVVCARHPSSSSTSSSIYIYMSVYHIREMDERSNFWLNIINSRTTHQQTGGLPYTDSTIEAIYRAQDEDEEEEEEIIFFVLFSTHFTHHEIQECRVTCAAHTAHTKSIAIEVIAFGACVPSSSLSSSFFMCACVCDDIFCFVCGAVWTKPFLAPNIRVSHRCETIACIWLGVGNRAFEIYVEFSNRFWCCFRWYFNTHLLPFRLHFHSFLLFFYRFFGILFFFFFFYCFGCACFVWLDFLSDWLWPILVSIFFLSVFKEQHREKHHKMAFSIKNAFCFCLDSNR